MDTFQYLRKIQKKERNNGTLARVEGTFYNDVHNYLDELKEEAITDPFSNAHGVLKEAQIIATDICERRESKITEAALRNIHRSYHLFRGKPQFDLIDTTPLNLTPEEEKFYFSLVDTLKNHRNNISLEKLSDDEESKNKSVDEPKIVQNAPKPSEDVETKNDEVLDRLDKIKNAKPIVDEKRESIEKQISDSKIQTAKKESLEDNPNAFDDSEQFYDFESQKVSKDANLVTMLVYDDVGPIVGVDEKVYGPFRSQDLVIMPHINAKIFVKNRKGRIVKI